MATTRSSQRARGRLPVLVVAVASVLAATACSSDGGEPSRPPGTRAPSVSTSAPEPSSTTSAPVAPTQDPAHFDFVNAVTLPEVSVLDIALTDTMALTMTAGDVVGRSLPDLVVVYSLPVSGGDFTDLEVDEDAGTGLVVATDREAGTGAGNGTDTYTLTEFALDDGHVLRSVEVGLAQDARAGSIGTTAHIVARVGDRVVLDAEPETVTSGDVLGEAAARHTTVVADLDDATDVWSDRPAAPLTARDDVVVLRTGTAGRPGRFEARAVDDGTLRWSALPGTKSARLVGVEGDLVVLTRLERPADRSTVVGLSLEDGTLRDTRPTFSWVWTCNETSRPVAVCEVLGKPVLIGWDLETNSGAWRLPQSGRAAPQVSTVRHDRAYGLLADHGVVLDALTGAGIADDTGAAPSEVSVWGGLTILGEQAVFQPVLPD